MKSLKLICLILAVLMVGCAFVACGDTGDKQTEASGTEAPKHDPININIIVRETEKGENKYASDATIGYDYEGDVISPLAILEEFMDFQYDIQIEYDANGKLAKVGDLVASNGHLWLWSLAKAPKGADAATPMDANIDAYDKLAAGDTIIIYLS